MRISLAMVEAQFPESPPQREGHRQDYRGPGPADLGPGRCLQPLLQAGKAQRPGQGRRAGSACLGISRHLGQEGVRGWRCRKGKLQRGCGCDLSSFHVLCELLHGGHSLEGHAALKSGV